MYRVVKEPSWEELIGDAEKAYHKLILITGTTGSGKTRLLKEVVDGAYDFGHLNLGEELSRKLLAQPIHLRPAEAESLAQDLIEEAGKTRVAIDNAEILFESPIAMDPLKFLKQASCHRTIVATWTGVLDQSSLTYGLPGHPAYRQYTYTPEDTFIIIPTENQL